MPDIFQIGDFDIDISEVLLVHKCIFIQRYKNTDYKNGRNMSGFVYCLNGRAMYDFGAEKVMLEPGQMIFLPECSSYVVQCAGEEPFSHYTVNFNIKSSSGAGQTAFSEITAGKLRHISSKDNAAAFKELLDRLLSVWQAKQHGYRTLAKSVLYELAYLYFTAAGKSLQNKSDYKKILPAKTALDEQYMTNITVPELAEMCRLSETHFRRLFVRIFGYSPTDYRLNKRLLKAKDLLLSGEFSVAETAAAVGFEDSNYFSRVFKAHTGSPPSSFIYGESV